MKTSATNAPGQGAPPVSHSPRPLTHPNQMLAWDVVCPSSPARLAWDVWMMALVAYLCCVVPYEVAFAYSSAGLTVVNAVVDAMFWIDLLMNFSHAAVARRYLRGWFAVDLVTTMPWDTMVIALVERCSLEDGAPAHAARVVPLIRVLRLLKIARMLRVLRLGRFRQGMMLTMYVGCGLLMLHLLACTWYFIATLVSPDLAGTWVERAGFKGAGPYELYTACVYWTVSTLGTVGFGDIVASNPPEMLYSIFAIVVGISVFAYTASRVSVLAADLAGGDDHVEARLGEVDTFLRAWNVPLRLALRVRSYLAFVLKRQVSREQAALVNELSAPLRTELVLALHRDALQAVPLLLGAHDPLQLADVVARLQLQTFAPADSPPPTPIGSSTRGEGSGIERRARSMGRAWRRVNRLSGRYRRLGHLTPGQHFGEYSALLGEPRAASVVAVEFCELFALSR
ncbi:Potassium voltage-gated channel subfamily Hmember 2 [Monoraphidium neglectum]|uniref:Potassium voltage-gated channel subfamily Hmember 2 n=1 Tax=Monoraphidium neglectum TaxID=145388 RepID=A0A0D2LJG9_9CHLO|nr:Potassium voltage-gated channel subfamily Hmember 2 [Monoraphidium neglectum]KIZ06554.1 Potassium voltage-gated channel subfamily Hmember 2 [Monoraphidium neglectum]|eukprot:XP_013905573.1 Potassium voltage-gated channel subfamily Hmember 2 [Monoraphidium neglectum]